MKIIKHIHPKIRSRLPSFLVAAAVLGPVVKHLFSGHALPAVVTGGVSLLLAACALSFVPRNDASTA